MIPPIDPWVWVLIALVLQPLIALLWAYVVIRGLVAYTTGKIGATIDNRVDNVLEQIGGDDA